METKMFALAEVKDAGDDGPNGSFEVILSAPTMDRDGEIVDSKVFEPLPDHITFDIDHGMSTASTVGSGKPYYDGDLLKVKGTYSSIPRAQEVRTLVKEGHIRTTSVAFMNAVRETKDGVQHVVKAELLNGAFVPIPSNRESRVLSAKSLAEKAGARNSTKDNERLQSIHDLAVDNGALCAVEPAKSVTAPVGVKAFHGLTAMDLRENLNQAVSGAHSDAQTYTWVRDYTDEWVVYEVTDNNTETTYQDTYTVTEGVVSLAGSPFEVTTHTEYVPVNPGTATSAPATPAPEAGKSPASNVVEFARLRAEAALLAVG